jgi:hypothetical protein
MIKPGDITDELIESVEAKVECDLGGWLHVPTRPLVTAILNAAIEAGLVSPRLPATDDPRVLRRAAEFLAAYYANTTTNPDCDGELQDAIELARTELEELARNGIDEA